MWSKGDISRFIKSATHGDITTMFVAFGRIAGHAFRFQPMILFTSLTWLASSSIQVIIDDVRNFNPMSDSATALRINKWKKSYFLILSFIEDIDRMFGPIFASFICILYNRAILTSYIVINVASLQVGYVKVSSLFAELMIILMGIIHCVGQMKSKVKFALNWHFIFKLHCIWLHSSYRQAIWSEN